jgi:hypothetical protein
MWIISKAKKAEVQTSKPRGPQVNPQNHQKGKKEGLEDQPDMVTLIYNSSCPEGGCGNIMVQDQPGPKVSKINLKYIL